MTDRINGRATCPVGEDWEEHRVNAQEAMERIATMHDAMTKLLVHTKHLDKLDKLEKLETIASGVTEMRDKFIEVIIGKNQIPSDSFDKMLKEINQTRVTTFKSMFIVIVGLVGILIFLLTGESLNWIKLLH